MPSFAYGASESLLPHLPDESMQLWDDIPELHVWGEAPDFTLHTARHPLGRVATIGACFTDEASYARAVATALENDAPEALTSFPGNYTTILITPESTKVMQDVAGIASVYYDSSGERPVISSQPSVVAGGKFKLLPEHIAAHIVLPLWDTGINGNQTCFEGVSKLRGGQSLEIAGQTSTLATYEPLNPDPHLTLEQGARQLRDAMRNSVRARMHSGIEIRSNLSGGVDSSSVVALTMEQLGPNDALQVYFMDDPDLPGGDRDYVKAYTDIEPRLTLNLINSHATQLTLDAETIKQPEDLELAVSPHRFQVISDIYASSKKAGAALHLSGNGGDEIVSVGSMHLPDLLASGQIVRLVKEGLVRAKVRNTSPLDIWHDVASLVLRGNYKSARKSAKTLAGNINFEPFTSPFMTLDPTKISPVTASFLTPSARRASAQLLLKQAEKMDTKTPTLGQFLARVQVRASGVGQAIEAYCVEQDSSVLVQAPFLDNDVVRAALAVEVQRKGDPYNFKLILQKALRGILPDTILNRNTKGVYDPHNARLNIETLGLLNGLMKDSRLAKMGIIDTDKLCSILPSLASLPPATLWALERVMTTELWLRSLESSNLTTIDRAYTATEKKPKGAEATTNQSLEGIFSVPDSIYAAASAKGLLTLYNTKANTYHPLDAVQSHILRAFGKNGSVNAVVDALAERYRKTPRQQLDTDTHRTLRNFADLGIITRSDVFTPQELPDVAQKARFISGESKMAQASEAERPRLHKRMLASAVLLGAVAISKIAPGKRLVILKGLQELIGGQPATYSKAQEALKTVQSIKSLGRVACMEASYAAALGLAAQRQHVDWHMGVSFYPVSYHSWIEANGSPVRTPIEGEVSGNFQSFFAA